LGAAGLAIDLGYLRYQRRLQQSAADSAAIAGAAESAAGNATPAAIQDAKLNGFNNGVNNVIVNVNPAFPFGAVTGVQVRVQAVHPTFFMRIFGVNNATVATTAVAINNSAKNCVYALNIFGTAISNSGAVTASGCGIVDDANLLNTGSINATSVAVRGSAFGSFTIPAAILGIVAAADPLYRLTPPGGGGGDGRAPDLRGAARAAVRARLRPAGSRGDRGSRRRRAPALDRTPRWLWQRGAGRSTTGPRAPRGRRRPGPAPARTAPAALVAPDLRAPHVSR